MRAAVPQSLRPVWWEDGGLTFIDQRFLPDEFISERANDASAILDALENGAIAGNGCAQIAGAFAAALARIEDEGQHTGRSDETIARLRPFFGTSFALLDRVAAAPRDTGLATAMAILAERRQLERSIAERAAALLPARSSILSWGSSGTFSTGAHGTALAAIIAAHQSGKQIDVFLGESRPTLTGRRLAAFECAAAGIATTVVPDAAASALMRDVPIAAVMVGAQAMAANGDVRAELGTYGLAVAAAHHRIPFYVALPRDAIDFACRTGTSLDSARAEGGPSASGDLTPGHLLTAIVTEYGVVRPPYIESLPGLATRPRFAFTNPRE